MINPEFLEYLIERICPHCQSTILYDDKLKILYCDICNSKWNYSEYKNDKTVFDKSANNYYSIYNYKKLSE